MGGKGTKKFREILHTKAIFSLFAFHFSYKCCNFAAQLIITTMGIIGSIIIGCLAGFCAGKLMKGGGFGFIMNLVLGLFGGVLGGWLFQQLGIQWGGLLGQLGTAIIGAVAILWIASLIKK